MITYELVSELYEKYVNPEDSRDSWDVAADIINEIITRNQYPNDPEYFYHVKEVWNLMQEYINATYK
jgi:hypothetical protein